MRVSILDWLDAFFPVMVGIGIVACLITIAVGISWRGARKEAEIYSRITGKNVTQSDMFWGSSMFKILPSDIQERK